MIIRDRTAPKPTGNSKTALKRCSEAWERLGVHPSSVADVPHITHVLQLSIGVDMAIENLRGSGSEIARKWLKVYDSLPKTVRSYLPIEAFCVASGVEPKKLLSCIVEETVESSGEVSKMLAALAHPSVVKSTVASAMLPGSEGARDRDMLHKHQGFVPINKNQVVNIGEIHGGMGNDNRRQSLQANIPVESVRDDEENVLKIGDRFNDEVLGENDDNHPVPDIEADAVNAEFLDES